MRIVHAMGARSTGSIPQEWVEGLADRGHDVWEVEAAGGRVSFMLRLRRTVKDVRPHVVHLHHTLPSLAAAVPGVVGRNARSVLTVHRLMGDMTSFAWTANTIGGLRVDVVVANSTATRESFPAIWRGRWVRQRVVHNGVDLRRLDDARAHRKDAPRATGIRILSVGRLIPDKGFDLLLEALAHVTDRLKQSLALTIVGTGPEKSRLQELARSLRIEGAVDFAGRVSRDEVYARLWSADLFALGSRTEGFCNAVVEAMAAGLPVVVTPAGALPEVVGSSGWIAERTTAADLADALGRALAAGELRRRAAGAEGARRAREKFSLQRTLDAYEAIYLGLVRRSSPSGAA